VTSSHQTRDLNPVDLKTWTAGCHWLAETASDRRLIGEYRLLDRRSLI